MVSVSPLSVIGDLVILWNMMRQAVLIQRNWYNRCSHHIATSTATSFHGRRRQQTSEIPFNLKHHPSFQQWAACRWDSSLSSVDYTFITAPNRCFWFNFYLNIVLRRSSLRGVRRALSDRYLTPDLPGTVTLPGFSPALQRAVSSLINDWRMKDVFVGTLI